ncbi:MULTISPECIES: magnesium/cobalt transporter CorA [Helicobacter]|uniref:Magnesium transport protein CorA n=1 Tax=Helicobacter ibis TaxID=2962633 RepID=A0ABT4VBP4_9HELI|nr:MULTISPECIES: magnesium/cobalt transporter CorA [Helicobacter]MDA3966892.1 magnesium/cobalt transporter CorA [Helicobacter sp. WB40]MDA3968119.1 magnesium/cobalt transporter CorA [Helicobacter ibis]
MLNLFIKRNGLVVRESIASVSAINSSDDILWIDLLHPTTEEIAYISKTYMLEMPTKEEREEIEESARYWEDSDTITINTYFLTKPNEENVFHNETITFLLTHGILFTLRYSEFRIFDEIQQRVLASPKYFEDGFDLITNIFELRVEKDADMLESIAKQTRMLRRSLFDKELSDEILSTLSLLEEMHLSLRDSLFDKRLAITALLRTDKVDSDSKKSLGIVLKDINSLVEFANVNMNILDNIQTLFASHINIEQNKIIKIFTVVTVAMMPPTLIATIYGMNFKHMPELEWAYSYPVVLCTMIVSTILPILYFKKKKWL